MGFDCEKIYKLSNVIVKETLKTLEWQKHFFCSDCSEKIFDSLMDFSLFQDKMGGKKMLYCPLDFFRDCL